MAKSPLPLRDLYPRITSFPTLLAAFHKARKGKRYRPEALAFAANLEAELFQLQEELRSCTYAPGPYRHFSIREPKPRLVSAAPFRDRVVHHALIAVIGPPLERRFSPTSYANRRGYGTHRGLRRFARACREHRWVLQADIRLYFPSIDHQLLLAQLEPQIACPGTLWLLRSILANGACGGSAIDAFPGDTLLTPLERPRGLPIGNLTSQFLANLHLNTLDHRLRALPGIRACLRYVDDLAFVGFHLIGGRIRLRNSSLLRIRRGLRGCARAVAEGRLTAARAFASAQSWDAHLAHGHTLRLRRRLFASHAFARGLPAPPPLI